MRRILRHSETAGVRSYSIAYSNLIRDRLLKNVLYNVEYYYCLAQYTAVRRINNDSAHSSSHDHHHRHQHSSGSPEPVSNPSPSQNTSHDHVHTHIHDEHCNHDHGHAHGSAKKAPSPKKSAAMLKEQKWSECWSCGTSVKTDDLFCKAPKCGVIQALQTSSVNFFTTFGLPTQYKIDEHYLDMEHKRLQMQLHPDRFATKSVNEKSVSTMTSAAINYAYEVTISLFPLEGL